MADTMRLIEPEIMPGETVHSNGHKGPVSIAICVPTFRHAATELLTSLPGLVGADQCSLILYDDGTADPALTAQLSQHIDAFPGPATLVTASQNLGRAQARNRLFAHTDADWVLFLDADMQPDDADFLTRYLDAITERSEPALIAGGFSLKHVEVRAATALHAAQSAKSECLDATARSVEPGRYVFTSNILVHRRVIEDVTFDPDFTGWGWEDVDWGLRVADRFEVLHIDNTATHLGLDTTDALMAKFGGSGANFAHLASRHPDAARQMTLYKLARTLSPLPFKGVLASMSGQMARTTALPMTLRLFGLKLYRAARYAEDI